MQPSKGRHSCSRFRKCERGTTEARSLVLVAGDEEYAGDDELPATSAGAARLTTASTAETRIVNVNRCRGRH